jgi:hypothetical protein
MDALRFFSIFNIFLKLLYIFNAAKYVNCKKLL